jgi:hypothetical protein
MHHVHTAHHFLHVPALNATITFALHVVQNAEVHGDPHGSVLAALTGLLC